MTILCDVDGVVADLSTEWVRRCNERFGESVEVEDITSWSFHKHFRVGELVYSVLQDEDLYDHIQPIKGAREGIETLRFIGHRVVFVSSCVIGSTDQKVEWLIEHGFIPSERSPRDFIAAHDKSLIRGDLLIDDGVHNVKAFPGPTILMDAPHNRSVDHPRRAHRWGDVVGMVIEGRPSLWRV